MSSSCLRALARRPPPNASLTPRATRALHASSSRQDMVAPPDPISHMRPVIYDTPASGLPAPGVRHPYSLAEFQAAGPHAAAPGEHELQFRIMRQQLDALHQNFWLDSNTRFYTARATVLASLPENASARAKEDALSAFFRQWVLQEKPSTDTYTAEWRRRNLRLIALAARVALQKAKTRFSRPASRPPAAAAASEAS